MNVEQENAPAPTEEPKIKAQSFASVRAKLALLNRRLNTAFYKRTPRERGLVALALLVGVGLLAYQVYLPVESLFAAQRSDLQRVERDAAELAGQVDRYLRLKAKRDDIERQYQGVEIKEGALSLLENLVKTKIGISSGFTIKEGTPKPIGGAYEQVPYAVKFTGQNLAAIIELLQEIVHGKNPMLLSEIDIRKSQRADRLEIEISVSSIRKSQK